jgi:hypothetical protein
MSEYSGFKIKRTHALAPLTSVYEAVAIDGRPGRFALKVFHPPASTDVRRFYALEGWLLAAERQQQAFKKDGTVVEVLATGRCEEGAFTVMPWQERTLEPWIKTLGHKGDTLRALTECLLNTLEKWEIQTGGPHGNLKPANVFLDRSGPLVGMTAQLSDPWFMPGAKVEQLRLADLAAIGAMLATIVRRRPPGAWPIEEAPEWKALGHGGKGWLDFCNYLLNPSPNEGEVTIAEARRRLRKVPKDANPAKTALLTGAGVLALVTLSVLGFARFGNPIYMPDKVQDLANKIGNPRAQITEVPRQWADLCVAWDTWLVDLQGNGKRLLRTEGLWDANDPLRREIENFVATANVLRLETLVPSSATEKRLGVLAKTPPPAVLKELQTPSVDQKVKDAGARLVTIQSRLVTWQRWEQLRTLQKLIEDRGFSRAASALAPKLPQAPGTPGYKLDVVRTLKLFNDVSLDDTGTLPLAGRWSEITRLSADMDASGDRVQKAMPAIITGRLADKSSLADFADSLTPPLEEMRLRRKQFLDPQVVRERFLKESDLLNKETAAVTEADFSLWEQELFQYSIVPAADDPRLATAMDDSARRLPASAVDLEADAPAAEPGGLPTLSAADFKREFDGLTAGLKSLRDRPIVRHDLPVIAEETTKLAGVFQLLEQRVEATLALLKPEIWLAKVAQAYGKFNETKQRWAAWQATLSGVTPAALTADRPRFRQLRANERQIKEWIDGLEGPTGFAALTMPELGQASADTSSELLRLEAVRREQAATAVAAAAVWRNALPTIPWAAAGVNVRVPLEAHRSWLGELPEFATSLDRLSNLLLAGFGWHEGVSDVVERLARFGGVDNLTGRPAEWHAEAKQLVRLVDNTDRTVLTAAAQSGGLSRKLMAWRRLGVVAGWPSGAADFDLDGRVVATMRELIGRDVQDETRRVTLFDEMVKETRLRFNRAAHSAARAEAQLTAMFERMRPAGITEEHLDEPVAYNLALWQLKRADWNESNLDRLRIRRDTFVSTVRAISGIPAQPAVSGLLETLSAIELKDDPNRPPTPSPRLAGWQEELTNEGLALTATWTSGGKKVQLEYQIVQPKDDTPPFYLARREIAVGEFVDLMSARTKPVTAVMEELPQWAKGASPSKPYNAPISWRPRIDNNGNYNGVELNPNWIIYTTAPVKGLLDDPELRASQPALEKVVAEKPTARSPLQQMPPEAAKIFAEQLLGARLPSRKEWQAVMKLAETTTDGVFRGPSFQELFNYLRDYKVASQVIDWRPNEGAFLPLVKTTRQKYVDDGQAVASASQGKLWFAPVDDGPAPSGFVNLFGNVWIYLNDGGKDFYVAGGSALSPPGVDRVEPHKVEAKGLIGATKVTEGFSDVGIRPAFDAPPGFRERYKLLVLVREQKYLTL